MEKKLQSAWQGLPNPVLFISLFALPWIEEFRLSTFLWIGLCLLVLPHKETPRRLARIVRLPLFWLFLAYFLLQLIAFCRFPADNHLSIEEKISLVIAPVLLFILISDSIHYWHTAARGFVYGTIAATLWCLFSALAKWLHSPDPDLFFYHRYSAALGLNAVYFSFYLLIAIAYIIPHVFQKPASAYSRYGGMAALFLYVNLLLLSSKLLIVGGSCLLLLLVFRSTKARIYRGMAFTIITGACLLLFLTDNPIKNRYAAIDMNNPDAVLSGKDFKGFPFDGLSFRLLMWRMGNEAVNENRAWITGLQGGRYHLFLNEKIIKYRLPEGKGIGRHKDYVNYNMNNQYMESYMQFGIAGVVVLMGILLYLICSALYHHDDLLIFTTALFTLAFLTESVLEMQSGILPFVILLSGQWIYTKKLLEKQPSGNPGRLLTKSFRQSR